MIWSFTPAILLMTMQSAGIFISALNRKQILSLSLDIILGSLSNCIDDKEQKQKRERTGYGKLSHTEENHTALNTEHRDLFCFLLQRLWSHLTLAKLAVLGTTEDNLNFVELKNRQQSCTFLKNLKHYLHTIPEDCREGLKELDLLISKKWDWNQDILPAWGLAA